MNTDVLEKLEEVVSEGMEEWEDVKISTALDSIVGKSPTYTISSDKFYPWSSSTSDSILTTSTGLTMGPSYTPMTLDEIEVQCNKYDSYIKEAVGVLERWTNDFVYGKITEVDYLKSIEDVVLKRSVYKLACSLLQEIKKED